MIVKTAKQWAQFGVFCVWQVCDDPVWSGWMAYWEENYDRAPQMGKFLFEIVPGFPPWMLRAAKPEMTLETQAKSFALLAADAAWSGDAVLAKKMALEAARLAEMVATKKSIPLDTAALQRQVMKGITHG